MSTSESSHQWVFGYGSLIWRPGFDYKDARIASLDGYSRRFWQGSHDHRGVPERPGRVVTLTRTPGITCTGRAYLVDAATVSRTFADLDHREKNGYERARETLTFASGEVVSSLVYIATPENFAYLGDAPLTEIAQQIATSIGPSGRNDDYLFALAEALRAINTHDEHVFTLEAEVRRIRTEQSP